MPSLDDIVEFLSNVWWHINLCLSIWPDSQIPSATFKTRNTIFDLFCESSTLDISILIINFLIWLNSLAKYLWKEGMGVETLFYPHIQA